MAVSMHPRIAKLVNDAILVARGWDYRPALRELESVARRPRGRGARAVAAYATSFS